MSTVASIHVSVKPEVKEQAEQIFDRFGLTISDAVKLFLHKAIMVGGIPFEVRQSVPNAETLEAIQEVEEMKRDPSLGKGYDDVDAMMADLLS